MKEETLLPYGIYDAKSCRLIYVGLFANEHDCWQVFLGWPDDEEIAAAKERGLACLSLTITYDPEKPL